MTKRKEQIMLMYQELSTNTTKLIGGELYKCVIVEFKENEDEKVEKLQKFLRKYGFKTEPKFSMGWDYTSQLEIVNDTGLHNNTFKSRLRNFLAEHGIRKKGVKK